MLDVDIETLDLEIQLPQDKAEKLRMLAHEFTGNLDLNLSLLASFLLAVALNKDGLIHQAMELLEDELH